MRALVAAVAVAVGLAGCGGGGDEPAKRRSSPLVDASAPPPLINAFEHDERTGEYLLTTNKGYFRIDARSDRVQRVEAKVTAGAITAPAGKFLELSATEEPGVLLGSGHPDTADLPEFLGLMRSEDSGRTWTVLSRLGEADLHEISLRGSNLYAVDAVRSVLLVSNDGGRTFRERPMPPGLVTSMVLDPDDSKRILISTEDQVHRSVDEGRRWRPVTSAQGSRLAWPAPDRLYRADANGAVLRSADGGDSWAEIGRIEAGEPYKLRALGPTRLAAALADGAIAESGDGGVTWTEAFRPGT